jgi:MscS family membrane protein
MDIVKAAGTGFAFPSQTAYFTNDAGLDAEKSREAESQVANWRSKGKLPFPEFDGEAQMQFEDTLDYPPAGSPRPTHRKDLPEVDQDPKTSQPASRSNHVKRGHRKR